MKKCEWKDGLLTCCDDFHREITRSFQSEEYWNDMYRRGYIKKCPHCGVRIDKPEPEVIIRKSGGTWVARYEGVDYLCTKPKYREDLADHPEVINFSLVAKEENNEWWKPISEIEITDEIAKLRPIVIFRTGWKYTLYGVTGNGLAITENGAFENNAFRLATVYDLEDSE